ncbi:hypothetical protein SNEBB_005594 [Seison nebaliae]|nr:hypothetical protein SNEBB_005594 [Seison nebaliae]
MEENKIKNEKIEHSLDNLPTIPYIPVSNDSTYSQYSQKDKKTHSTNLVEIKKEKLQKSIKKEKVEFDKLMSGLVICLSGYTNPLRMQIRNQCLAMGATYSTDVNETVTHLISAFPNTPKVKKVLSWYKNVKIVKVEWMYKCQNLRTLLNTKHYLINSSPINDDEIVETTNLTKNDLVEISSQIFVRKLIMIFYLIMKYFILAIQIMFVNCIIQKMKNAFHSAFGFSNLTDRMNRLEKLNEKKPLAIESKELFDDLVKHVDIPYPTITESDNDEVDDDGKIEQLKRTRIKYSLAQQAFALSREIERNSPNAIPLASLLKALARSLDTYKRLAHDYKKELYNRYYASQTGNIPNPMIAPSYDFMGR